MASFNYFDAALKNALEKLAMDLWVALTVVFF